MKAFVYEQYGDANVLEFKELEKPIPKDNEILVRIYASTVSAGVIWMRKGEYPNSTLFTFLLRLHLGISKPKINILGIEYAGVIEAVGKEVHYFQKGDRVFGTTTGLKNGTYADYVCVPEKGKYNIVARMPCGISFEEATALPIGGMTALCILKRVKLQVGQSILIYGASGSVGTFAVQIAKYFGAKVTAVCSGKNIKLVKSIGADEVIDYTIQTDYLSNEQYDIVFDAVGKMPQSNLKFLLKPSGRFCTINSLTDEKLSHIHQLLNMLDEQKLKVVIDRTYSFVQLTEAHEYVEQGHKRGNVVISHLLT
jgi:NADPH:quinone reductase-like Zn-dependent oxidoreductase